jgi:hypothetical protein
MKKTSTHIALVALILALAGLAAGCGGSGDKKSASPAAHVEAFDSPYCVTARKWAVHELNGGGDAAAAQGGPAALKKWWHEQLAYLKTSLRQVPPQIRDAEALNEHAIRAVVTPVLEKYDFNPMRLEAEASAAEKAVATTEPPRDVARAQEVRNRYQNSVCGYGGPPPAADVTFTKSAAAKPYCQAVAEFHQGLEEISSSGFDPEASRSYVTSGKLSEALETQDATAPSEIAADVKADNEWARTHQIKVWEKFDYDLRRILLEGSADDLAAFTYWDPAIATQDSRVTAYQEQVCGGQA